MANGYSNEMNKIFKQATKQGLVVEGKRTGDGKVCIRNLEQGTKVYVSGSPGSRRCVLNNVARMRRHVGFVYNGH
jgi:hypothetical protein